MAHDAPRCSRPAAPDVSLLLERHRIALTAHCYRVLGSGFEAEDAVQETLIRAWRSFSGFDERRGPWLPWLHAIATRICLDMLRSAQRRARAMDLAPASYAGAPLGVPLPGARWVHPIPDSHVLPAGGDTGEPAIARDTLRLAFVADLQHLPPRQRAVLILRDVLCWKADEASRLLGTAASVNSALQRARATLGARNPTPVLQPTPGDADHEQLLARYVDAFERDDVEALVSLLHQEATMSMPPSRGGCAAGRKSDGHSSLPDYPVTVRAWCGTAANGSPAFGQYPAGRRPLRTVRARRH